MITADDFIDNEEAATLRKVKPSTLDTERCRGRGPVYYKYNGKIYYRKNELLAWTNKNFKRIKPNNE